MAGAEFRPADMTAPPVARPRSSGWTLTEAIGLETLQAIQDAFARAFGIRVRQTIFGGAVLLVIGAHALADFVEDAFYFINHLLTP